MKLRLKDEIYSENNEGKSVVAKWLIGSLKIKSY